MDELRRRARHLRNHTTDAERHLWKHLRLRQLGGYRFRRQVPIAQCIADFLCPEARLIVELDGGQHQEQARYDGQRSRYLADLGYRVARYWSHDVLFRTHDVLDDVLRHLRAMPVTAQALPTAAAVD